MLFRIAAITVFHISTYLTNLLTDIAVNTRKTDGEN